MPLTKDEIEEKAEDLFGREFTTHELARFLLECPDLAIHRGAQHGERWSKMLGHIDTPIQVGLRIV